MADATGALMFLKTLVVNYLKIVHPVLAHEDLSLGIEVHFEKRIRTASVSIITRKRKIQVCPS